ncbi:PREDICTED: DNA cross-link repair 1A protein isoform X2 [Papilio polytes]|uniref:DNA cross-link repair 1A protein isoform X2 n=1 Tax=Papilio polytes TaxID=76194 RepID=UPI00067668AE|nr:PREDICTED: DNA cross-link repair 1A protein isoform X2 [Papilio polytes]
MPRGVLRELQCPEINTKKEKEKEKIIQPKDIDILGHSAIEDPFHSKENNIGLSEEFNSFRSYVSSKNDFCAKSDDTIIYDYNIENPVISLAFKFDNTKNVKVGTVKTIIKKFSVSHENDDTNITCNLIEDSSEDIQSEGTNMSGNANVLSPDKQTVAVNLEIKRERATTNDNITEEEKILILNTNAIDKLSHVIVQPPNYKFVKRDVSFCDKSKTGAKAISNLGRKNGKISVRGDGWKQTTINDYFGGKLLVHTKESGKKFIQTPLINSIYAKDLVFDDVEDMSKNSGVNDTLLKYDKIRPTVKVSRENDMQSKARLCSPKRDSASLRQQDLKASSSEVPRSISPKLRNGSISSFSPRKNLDSIHFSLPSKTRSNKTNANPRNIPFYKIVAGTHFAVDAFSYGDIPNVNIYFLTHFHSDHYTGLKRTFNKTLYCSKITADLCVARLGVNPKHLQILNIDDTIKIEGIDVTAVDANHCPGAIMLVFTLPNGKNLLHTGDFRASPFMESYPVFWNKDMHTIYLDTTYCNPRYDFPTQDQSLEMALNLLRDKKTKLEEAGKKFSSVLIVCGAYTIGKEKFFLGIARRVGCLVWACPEKDRVLQVVEGQSFGRSAPHTCQLHVVPMRELTHEKLRAHLDSLQGAFSEVVAFKPSGWENDKATAVTRDAVTIHGIPYSEHSSFSELIRFVKFLKPKQVVPTVDISGGVKTVQQFFPCPLVYKEDLKCQSRLTDYFGVQSRQRVQPV